MILVRDEKNMVRYEYLFTTEIRQTGRRALLIIRNTVHYSHFEEGFSKKLPGGIPYTFRKHFEK